MKTQDLMLGDWVQGHFPNTTSKVVGIPNEYRLAVITPGGAYMELSIDDFLPIPLTPELLRKYFPDTEDGVLWWKDEDGMHVETETYGDIMVSGLFHYMHELQHALRLVGIEKEIKL